MLFGDQDWALATTNHGAWQRPKETFFGSRFLVEADDDQVGAHILRVSRELSRDPITVE